MCHRIQFIAAVAAIFMVFLVGRSGFAAGPGLTNYQGRLTSPGGIPLAGTYSVKFSIYESPTGGIAIWDETHSITTDANGFFTVVLGGVTSFLDNAIEDSARYMGITIGADPELIPRSRITASPWAMRTRSVQGATGGVITGGTVAIGGFFGEDIDNSLGIHFGVQGLADASTNTNIGVQGTAYDVNQLTNSAAVYGLALSHAGGTVWGGYFDGWTKVVGNFYASAKFFKIDDPVDPANRTLQHACVESNEFKDVYDGDVTLDQGGEAVVTMPTWFGALNNTFRYQLTAIGVPGPNLYIAQKVTGNTFKIAGGVPGMEVNWQVTGVRKDAYAAAHPFSVVEDKPAQLRGKYLNPIENGMDEKLGVDYPIRERAIAQQKMIRDQARAGSTSQPPVSTP